MRKGRGPQKGAPNSARDLLPMLQPTTKALAQMLAGRTAPSGQLGQARAMLAHAERLIAERGHNRLSPSEREEFFEQLARLRLTLADADAEAEADSQAQQEEGPKPPERPPIGQDRLREMVLALSRPQGGTPAPKPSEPESAEPPAAPAASGPPPAGEAAEAPSTAAGGETVIATTTVESTVGDSRRPNSAITRSGRLTLSKTRPIRPAPPASSAGEGAALEPTTSMPTAPAATPPSSDAAARRDAGAPATSPQDGTEAAGGSVPVAAAPSHERRAPAGNGIADEDPDPAAAGGARRRPKKVGGLPEGWVIDDEGYVVPGPSRA